MLNIYLSMFDDVENQNKFEQLYHDYKYLMLYIANQVTGNNDWAEDIVHDAFFNIAKNFDKIKFESEKKTRALVAIITENCAINFNKKESRVKFIEEDETIDDYCTYRRYENQFESSVVNVIYAGVSSLWHSNRTHNRPRYIKAAKPDLLSWFLFFNTV